MRPVYHRLERRIRSHLNICFCAYKIYKELERRLKQKGVALSVQKAIELLKSIYTIDTLLPASNKMGKLIIPENNEQRELLNALDIKY
jgi:transposase